MPRIPIKGWIGLLARYLRPYWAQLLLLLLLITSGTGLYVWNPQYMGRFVDGALNGVALSHLTGIALMYLAFAVISQLISSASSWLAANVGWMATNDMRQVLAEHCLNLDISFHKTHRPGEMLERLDGDIGSLGHFFSGLFIEVGASLLLMVGTLVMLFRVHWLVGVGMSLFVVIAIVGMGFAGGLIVPAMAAERQATADLWGYTGEVLSATEDVAALGAKEYILHEYTGYLRRFWAAEARLTNAFSAFWGGSNILAALGMVVAFGLGAYLSTQGAITIGSLTMLMLYTQQLRKPINDLRSSLEQMQTATASIQRLEELQQTASAIQDGPGLPLPEGPLAVAFEGVTFSYDAETPVLRSLSFALQPGKVLGLVGRTGSGKSTISRLLYRFYDPQEGAVLIGGVDIRQGRKAELRRRIGLVPQDVQLFRATLRDNLTFFEESITDQRLTGVLQDLGLGEWLAKLPQGLDTMLEPGGAGLSVGESQLVAFARVFLADPSLVILDEASSRLDPYTERLVEGAVDKLLAGRTAILIAHRLGTVQRADEILVLEDGVAVEHGERTCLAATPTSRFHQLLTTGLEEVPA